MNNFELLIKKKSIALIIACSFICILSSCSNSYATAVSLNIKYIKELSETNEYFEYEQKLIKRSFISAKVGNIAYSIYLPPGFEIESNKKWPVILFIHGAWELGREGKVQTLRGIGEVLIKHPENYPAIVIMPQSPFIYGWVDNTMDEIAIQILNNTLNEFNGDPSRIYLTGLSLGGSGVWRIAILYPDIFAAIVPICPGYPFLNKSPDFITNSLINQNIRVFHGSSDRVWPYEISRYLVDQINKRRDQTSPTGSADLITYEKANHFIWERAFTDERLYKWMFEQRLLH